MKIKHTTHDSIAWRITLSRNNAVSVFCMILSVCHITVEEFRPTRLCKTALNYWGLQAFVMHSIRSFHSISIRLVFGLLQLFWYAWVMGSWPNFNCWTYGFTFHSSTHTLYMLGFFIFIFFSNLHSLTLGPAKCYNFWFYRGDHIWPDMMLLCFISVVSAFYICIWEFDQCQ